MVFNTYYYIVVTTVAVKLVAVASSDSIATGTGSKTGSSGSITATRCFTTVNKCYR